MAHDLGLLLDAVALEAQARPNRVIVPTEGMAAEREHDALLMLPDMDHFMNEQPLVIEPGSGEIVAVERAVRVEMERPARCHHRLARLEEGPFAPDDADLNAYNLNLTLHNVMMLTPMWKGLDGRLKAQAAIVSKVLALVAEGKLKLRLSESFGLADAAKAQSFLESGKAVGKVTLRMNA